MRTVYKYEIEPETTLDLPNGYQFLHVGREAGPTRDRIVAWFLVDSEAHPQHKVSLFAVPTGVPIPDVLCRYLGTVTGVEGPLVFHVFERFLRNATEKEAP